MENEQWIPPSAEPQAEDNEPVDGFPQCGTGSSELDSRCAGQTDNLN